MRHILPFPYPDLPEHAEDRRLLLTKLAGGRLVRDLPPRTLLPPFPSWMNYPCWHHAGKWQDGRGYKKVKYRGHTLYVHRAGYELLEGPIPDGYVLDHLCRDRGCWQPGHLEPVPNVVNVLRGESENVLLRQSQRAVVLAGVVGDQLVELRTDRPEHWTTPDLLQAHIDHAHPRFRKPLGPELLVPVPLPTAVPAIQIDDRLDMLDVTRVFDAADATELAPARSWWTRIYSCLFRWCER